MDLLNYVGHPLQIRGAERVTMHGGRGEGMEYLIVRNGLGLELWISLDRCADLSRLTYRGVNMGYFSPCGHVSSAYYDKDGAGFLKSFTAGFFTTAGLCAVGSPCTDDGEELPLHGTVANLPSELKSIEETDDGIKIIAEIRDCTIFARKLVMLRTYSVSYGKNTFSVSDRVTNEGDTTSPYMILYHCNMGYPLVCENSIIKIPSDNVVPRNKHAEENLDTRLSLCKPTPCFEESCYYYDVKKSSSGKAKVGIFEKSVSAGVVISYCKDSLPCFTEWKMMGKKDYVLGLEPGNCTPDGRDVLRKENRLMFLSPDESKTTGVTFTFHNDINEFEGDLK